MLDAVIVPCTFEGKNIFDDKCQRVVFIDNYVLIDPQINANTIEPTHFEPLLCYIGSLSENRGITNTIIAAYKAQCNLILAGNFDVEEYKQKLEQMKEYKIVDYRGVCSKKEILDILAESNVGIALLLNRSQFHRADNLPTKVYEYMLKGMPVIIYDAKIPRRILSKYEFGIAVNPDNIEEITTAINFLRNNPREAAKMGENGRRAVLTEYNWDNEEKKLIALYNEIL